MVGISRRALLVTNRVMQCLQKQDSMQRSFKADLVQRRQQFLQELQGTSSGETLHGGENVDWHSGLFDVYNTLKDIWAPDDAKRDACLK